MRSDAAVGLALLLTAIASTVVSPAASHRRVRPHCTLCVQAYVVVWRLCLFSAGERYWYLGHCVLFFVMGSLMVRYVAGRRAACVLAKRPRSDVRLALRRRQGSTVGSGQQRVQDYVWYTVASVVEFAAAMCTRNARAAKLHTPPEPQRLVTITTITIIAVFK